MTIKTNMLIVTEEEYNELIDEVSLIDKYNEKTSWISVKDCKKIEQNNPTQDVVLFYLWLLETYDNPTPEHRDTLDYIDEYLQEHLTIKTRKNVAKELIVALSNILATTQSNI